MSKLDINILRKCKNPKEVRKYNKSDVILESLTNGNILVKINTEKAKGTPIFLNCSYYDKNNHEMVIVEESKNDIIFWACTHNLIVYVL